MLRRPRQCTWPGSTPKHRCCLRTARVQRVVPQNDIWSTQSNKLLAKRNARTKYCIVLWRQNDIWSTQSNTLSARKTILWINTNTTTQVGWREGDYTHDKWGKCFDVFKGCRFTYTTSGANIQSCVGVCAYLQWSNIKVQTQTQTQAKYERQ